MSQGGFLSTKNANLLKCTISSFRVFRISLAHAIFGKPEMLVTNIKTISDRNNKN